MAIFVYTLIKRANKRFTVDSRIGILSHDRQSAATAQRGNEDDMDLVQVLLHRRKNGTTSRASFLATLSKRHEQLGRRTTFQVIIILLLKSCDSINFLTKF